LNLPNKIETLPDGNLNVELETGEKFTGNPLEVTAKLADAQVNTKRWGQGFKQELETLRSTPPPQPVQQQPVDQNEAQLVNYMGEMWAKWAGYPDGNAAKRTLGKIVTTTDKIDNNLAAADFLNLNQDFPNTPKSVEILSHKVEEMGWDFSPQSMTAAHALLVREHAQDQTKGYAPLTQQQISETWSQNLQASNQRPTAPPMLQGSNPEQSSGGQLDPNTMSMADLRKLAIQQQLQQK
jgi:hypothetical protein